MTIPVSQVRTDIAEIVDRVRYTGEPVVISKNGKNVAALVSIADLERLEAALDELDTREAERLLSNPAEKPVPFVRSKRAKRS